MVSQWQYVAVKGVLYLTKLALNDRLRKKLYNLLYNTINFGKGFDVDFTTGLGYSDLSIISNSAVGLVKGHDGIWGAKPAGYLAGLEGARVNGSAPVWDDGSGNALSGVVWRGPLAETTTVNIWSKPEPGNNDWGLAGAGMTDGGNVPGPDGNATSARRITGGSEFILSRVIVAGTNSFYGAFIAKGTAGQLGYWHFDNGIAPFNRKRHIFTGGWDLILNNNPTSAPGNYLYFDAADRVGSDHGSFSQTVDFFLIQVSLAPYPVIPTTGSNLTRLAETVTKTVTALGTEFSIMGTLDLSGGLPTSTLDIITSGADKIQVNSTGKLIITDGTLTTTSTASLSAAAGQKFGFSRTAAGSTLQIGATQEAGEAVDWSGDTVLTVGTGAPLQRWSVWSERALSAGEMSGYA